MIQDVSDRKRNDDNGNSERESKGKTRRRGISPPSTSTLIPLLTLPTLFTPTSLNTILYLT